MKYAKWNMLLIGGVWREGSSSTVYDNQNPYSGETLVSLKLANERDIDEAYRSAEQAQKGWEATPAFEKCRIIEKAIHALEARKDEVQQLIIDELGGTRLKAHVELELTTGFMKEAATYPLRMNTEILPSAVPGKENRIYRTPVGVVGVIAPWNFPLHLAMRSVVSALATGNGVVLKPDLQTCITGGMLICEVFQEAGLPDGLLNLIVTDLAETGDAVIEHPIPRLISFTGSTAAGRHIAEVAGRHLKKAALELGGNSAFVVLDDADLEQAASAAVFGKFMHHGQICMAVNRFIVDRSVYPEFSERLKEKMSKLKTGDPADPDTVIGPLINRRQVDRVLALIEKSVEEGARIMVQGEVKGNLIEPFLIIDAKNEMTIAQTEIFGPVAVIIPVDGEEAAIRAANDTPNGLSGAVFTGSLERGLQVGKQIKTGMLHINDQSINDEPHIAFGGEKASGLGRFGGEWALEEFTTYRWISLQNTPRAYPFS